MSGTAQAPAPDPGPLGLAVIGLGRAGQARCRDIAASADVTLIGALGGREGIDAHRRLIEDPRTDAVLVCTDNALHAELATLALEAGRDALVEFPLAGDSDETAALLRLAEERGRVLHLELIGLLGERHRGLRLRADEVAAIDVDFAGGRYRWIDAEIAAGHHGQLAIGRLHAVWDLCGPLRLLDARRHDDGATSALELRLLGAAGQQIRLRERRGPDLARASAFVARDAAGRELAPRPVAPLTLGLFATDLDRFVRRVRTRDADGAYVDADAILGVARLADAISHAAAASV